MLALTLALALTGPVVWLDPQDVKAGQRGVCITEWTNGVRREIPVEVVGVLDAAAPERTSVLVRLEDPELEGGGVAAGMSGSPVYVDGKLLGAVAFGWAFAREPLAGVTPFATMRDIGTFAPPAPLPPPTLQQLAALGQGTARPPGGAAAPRPRWGRNGAAGRRRRACRAARPDGARRCWPGPALVPRHRSDRETSRAFPSPAR